ncbi:MAG TPA: phosphatase PAP2 family protein [Verrucomicrobiae bacterium]|jgi:undecaprenyl-diphosphatase|nr:phosphatase PAP2 family protein [Verrucomicrobiae bacterium]
MTETSAIPAPPTRSAPIFPAWVWWLALSSFAVGAALLGDGPIDRALQVHSDGVARTLAYWLTRVGEWWAVGAVGLVFAGVLFSLRQFKTAQAFLTVTAAGLATGFTGTLLRTLIGRTRPNASTPEGFYGPWHDGHWIIGHYQFSSFPSGHAATLVGLAVAAWLVNRRAGVVTGLFALAVSWSRVAQSSHHFSDIIAATVLGLWLAPWFLQKFQRLLTPRRDDAAVINSSSLVRTES